MKQKHPMVWWEACTPDGKKTADYLAKIFGWEIQGGGHGSRYFFYTVDPSSNGFAGGGFMSWEGAPMVTVYIQVDDVRAKLDEAVEAGGKVVKEPFHVPGVGTVCLFAEPGGAVLGMIKPEHPE